MALRYQSLSQIQSELKSGTISCIDLVQYYIDQIEKNKQLNAFLEVFKESALEKAKHIDEQIAAGKEAELFGLVVGIKDNICYKNHKVSASSKILDGFESIYSATAIERLVEKGAIIIGRLNCDEFAMGSSNENSAFGPVKNPVNEAYVPGGSSGGSCAAVKAGLCLAALGSDTGGSIRQPASFCGVVGFKPGYGRVSRHGLIAYASSFDQIGPITNTVEDAAKIYNVIAGRDEYDGTLSGKTIEIADFSEQTGAKRIAVLSNYVNREGIDEEIKNQIKALTEKYTSEGHVVEEIDFPFLEYLVPTYYVLTTAEASSNLARFDGIHYGYRSPEASDVETSYSLSRSQGFGEEVKRRIILGTYVLSSGYYDAYFSKAQKVRNLIRRKTLEIFKNYDFILTPTTPTTAFKIGEKSDDPITMYLQDIFTVQANLTGIPAISLPSEMHSNGLPVGVQLMADNFKEAELLSFSNYTLKLINSKPV